MKYYYLYGLAIVLLLQLLTIFFTLRKRTDSGRWYVTVLLCQTALMIFYVAYLQSKEVLTASLMLGLYYMATDSFVLSMYYFLRETISEGKTFNGLVKRTGFQKKIKLILIPLVAADSTLLIANVFNSIYFNLTPVNYNDITYFFKPEFKPLIHIHIAVVSFIILISLIDIIRKTYRSNNFYKLSYWLTLALEIMLVLLQGIPMYSKIVTSLLDLSPFFTPFCAITIFILFFKLFPRKDVDNIIQHTADNISSGLFVFDSDNRCVYKNKKGLELEKIFTKSEGSKYLPDHFIENFYRAFIEENITEGVDELVTQKEIILTDGEKSVNTTFEITWAKILDKTKRVAGTYLKLKDRTVEIQKLNDEKFQASHDKLTKLLNRQAFFDMVIETLQKEKNKNFLMIVSNVVGFKLFNTQFGTESGDRILKEISSMFKNKGDSVRNSVQGRISGDKIAMLIQKEDFDQNYFLNEISRIQNLMNNISYKLQIKLGIYEIQDHNESVQTMFDKAIVAINSIHEMYSLTITWYDMNLMEKIKYEKNIVNSFINALDNKQFVMFLQPQIDWRTNKVTGAEALVRWHHPTHGLMAPGLFVHILENKGYIHQMDAFIWEEAVKKLAEWKLRKIDYHISVNISAKDFHYLNIYKIFTDLVEKYGVSPGRLNLEITETIYLNEIKTTTSLTIQRLRDYGFHVEIDDFGSGYSSLSMLKNLKVDTLKIDMEFLRQTDNVERSKAILAEIITMAKQLGMKVINEGVETEAQVKFLSEKGSDLFQGYYFSRPIPVKEFESKYLGIETEGGN